MPRPLRRDRSAGLAKQLDIDHWSRDVEHVAQDRASQPRAPTRRFSDASQATSPASEPRHSASTSSARQASPPREPSYSVVATGSRESHRDAIIQGVHDAVVQPPRRGNVTVHGLAEASHHDGARVCSAFALAGMPTSSTPRSRRAFLRDHDVEPRHRHRRLSPSSTIERS
jgi:hypothetical protein